MNDELIDTNEDLEYNFEELDSTWINNFEAKEQDYNSYYKESISFIRINYIYINKENEIINISEEKCLFKKPGILSKEELIGLIKHNTFHNAVKYSLLSILKYNIDFEPIHLKTFLRSKDINIGKNYLSSITNIDNIVFEQSISLFHDINNLFIIFIDKSTDTVFNPKHNPMIRTNKQSTKKVYIHTYGYYNNKKRTKRNLFKEMV
jgi:hypothetical protein